MKVKAEQPIGIFDSGIGGLTVVQALRRILPNESLVYLGDTARVPYGNKSPDVVERYATTAADFLARQQAKVLVIACNTATAYASEHLAQIHSQPVIGVIEPGAQQAVRHSKSLRIGVIGTEGTIRSQRYQNYLKKLAPRAQVFSTSCPLFVPLAEEGLHKHAATKLLAQEYLAPLCQNDIDTLILGCTHYPLLRDIIQEVCGPAITLIDSAQSVALEVAKTLEQRTLLAKAQTPALKFFATDSGERFARVGKTFLGETITAVEHIDL